MPKYWKSIKVYIVYIFKLIVNHVFKPRKRRMRNLLDSFYTDLINEKCRICIENFKMLNKLPITDTSESDRYLGILKRHIEKLQEEIVNSTLKEVSKFIKFVNISIQLNTLLNMKVKTRDALFLYRKKHRIDDEMVEMCFSMQSNAAEQAVLVYREFQIHESKYIDEIEKLYSGNKEGSDDMQNLTATLLKLSVDMEYHHKKALFKYCKRMKRVEAKSTGRLSVHQKAQNQPIGQNQELENVLAASSYSQSSAKICHKEDGTVQSHCAANTIQHLCTESTINR